MNIRTFRNMSSCFDDKAGIVSSNTEWGSWCQTMEDVTITVKVPSTIRSKHVSISILPTSISCSVFNDLKFKGEFVERVIPDESTWTLEDEDGARIIRIMLCKSNKTPESCWKSLLVNSYQADVSTYDGMQKKMLQERFQREHPGFDFSQAEVSGNYQNGGPKFDS